MTQYYYTVKIKGYKSVKTIAQDGREAKHKVSTFESIPLTQIKFAKRGEALNLLEMPND